jgi:hypothetical protein
LPIFNCGLTKFLFNQCLAMTWLRFKQSLGLSFCFINVLSQFSHILTKV